MDVTPMYSATIGGNSIYDVYRGVYLGQEYCVLKVIRVHRINEGTKDVCIA